MLINKQNKTNVRSEPEYVAQSLASTTNDNNVFPISSNHHCRSRLCSMIILITFFKQWMNIQNKKNMKKKQRENLCFFYNWNKKIFWLYLILTVMHLICSFVIWKSSAIKSLLNWLYLLLRCEFSMVSMHSTTESVILSKSSTISFVIELTRRPNSLKLALSNLKKQVLSFIQEKQHR